MTYQFSFCPQHHSIGYGMYSRHLQRMPYRNFQPLTLTYGIKRITFMLTKYVTAAVHKKSARKLFRFRKFPFQEGAVIVIGDETYFVALALLGQINETHINRHSFYFCLLEITNGKHGSLQTFLRNSPQNIALVFSVVKPF